MRRDHVHNLVKFFNNKPLGAITPQDVRKYRQQRVGPKGRPLAIQSINHDHTALVHMLNVARSPQFGLIKANPVGACSKAKSSERAGSYYQRGRMAAVA